MDNIREVTYKINGLKEATDSQILTIKTDFGGVKGVIAVTVNKDEETVNYALDQWASDYDVLCKLGEICESLGFELVYTDEEGDVANTEVIAEVEQTPIEQDEEVDEVVKKGKLTKSDFIEKIIIFGLSIVLTVVALFINKNETLRSWIFMLGFTIASYETLYNAVVKVSEKKYIIEEVMTFVGALIFMYLGYTVSATAIMLSYGIVNFLQTYATHKNVSYIENFEQELNKIEDQNEKDQVNQTIQFLSNLDGVCDNKTSKFNQNKLKYNIATVITAFAVAFIPPIFSKDYGIALTSNWLYLGASILVLGCFGNIVYALINTAKISIFYAKNQGVKINDYPSYLTLANSEGVCFDKTGVVTERCGEVVEVVGEDKSYILKLSASVLKYSKYHVADTILSYVGNVDTFEIENYSEAYGNGITCTLNGEEILLGNSLLMKKRNVEIDLIKTENSVVYIAKNGKYLGAIILSYKLKDDAFGACMEIKEDLDLKVTIVSSEEASQVSSMKTALAIDGGLSRANSTKKADYVNRNNFVYVGHNVYDKNTLNKLDKSIAFGGDKICIENNEVKKVPFIIKMAKRTAKLLKMINRLPFVVKSLLFILLLTTRVFLSLDSMWCIALIDLICSIFTLHISYLNETEVV